ncbi:MAG: cytochrome B, partial [Armatimonadota bacterium]
TEIPHTVPIARVNCSRCHYVDKIVGASFAQKSGQYRESVHKAALEQGNAKAPTCQDCHGTHYVLPPTDPCSPIHRSNIPATCGECHLEIYADYRESVHGRALREGNVDVPVCTDCHGEHNIQAVADENSKVNPKAIVQTCSSCHAAEGIMAKYGVPTEQYYSYRDSYHGVANQYGSTTVANCASCHTAHNVRPSSDPLSSVHVDNLPNTCGKCHRGANPNFAKGKMHVVVSREESPGLFYVSSAFKWLTIGTMCALVGHIMLDLIRRYRSKRSGSSAH